MRLFLLLLLTVSLACAQDSTISYNHRYVLKLDLGALIDFDRTVQVGLEFPIGPQSSWQVMAGYGGMKLQGGDLQQFLAAEVWGFRNEIRFYTGRYQTNRAHNINIKSVAPLGNYWALELLGKQVNVANREYCQFCDLGIYPSSRITNQRYITASHFKIGRQFSFPWADRRLTRTIVDLYLGAGIRYAIVKEQGEHLFLSERLVGFRNRFEPGNRFAPSFVGGVKMGFGL